MQMQTLRRCVLNVTHVEVETSAIKKKTAVAGRLFIIAVMQIDRPGLGFPEKIVLYLGWPELRVSMRLLFA